MDGQLTPIIQPGASSQTQQNLESTGLPGLESMPDDGFIALLTRSIATTTDRPSRDQDEARVDHDKSDEADPMLITPQLTATSVLPAASPLDLRSFQWSIDKRIPEAADPLQVPVQAPADQLTTQPDIQEKWPPGSTIFDQTPQSLPLPKSNATSMQAVQPLPIETAQTNPATTSLAAAAAGPVSHQFTELPVLPTPVDLPTEKLTKAADADAAALSSGSTAPFHPISIALDKTPYGNHPQPQAIPIDTPITSTEWPREFGRVTRMMINGDVSHAQLHINPPELGPIEVRLKIDGESASISFSASSADTRSLLESHIPRLREALDTAGLQLTDALISQGGPHRDSRETPANMQYSQTRQGELDPPFATSMENPTTDSPRIRGNHLIDIFA